MHTASTNKRSKIIFTEDIYLGRGRIKNDAVVGVDHSFSRWLDSPSDPVFDIHSFTENTVICIAFGYGVLNTRESYGCGSLYVHRDDIIWTEDLQLPNVR